MTGPTWYAGWLLTFCVGYATFTNTEEKSSNYVLACPPLPVFLGIALVNGLYRGYFHLSAVSVKLISPPHPFPFILLKDATTTIADQLEAFRVGNASESGDEVLSFQRAVPIVEEDGKMW